MTTKDKKTGKNTELIKKIKEEKKLSESYIVLNIFKNPQLYFDTELTVNDISSKVWRFYFAIAQKLILDGKKILDDVTVNLYMETRKQAMQDLFDSYGGYDTIKDGVEFVRDENFEGYESSIIKYNTIIKLAENGFDLDELNISAMTVEEIEDYWESKLSTIFAEVDSKEKVVDLSKGLMEVVDKANEGLNRGFPYESALLNKYVNGMPLGNITMLSAGSGVGKTFFSISQILPKMIEMKESLTIMANEEDEGKWKTAIIVWAVNNMVKFPFNKSRMNEGSFSKEEYKALKEAVAWLEDKMKKDTIRFVNFNSFSMKKSIKIIKREKAIYKTNYYLLDTLKMDSDSKENEQVWLKLQNNMVKLYDIIKPANLNVHVFVTYQLSKSSMQRRYLDQSSLGMSKNVVDVCSTLMLLRKAMESEKEDGSNEVWVERENGVKQKMSKDKSYFILFLGKNRMNENHKQLVFEADMGKNTVKDFGLCMIDEDF